MHGSSERSDRAAQEGVTVLRAIWTARGADADVRAEIGAGTGRTCRKLKDVGFDGDARPVDEEQRLAWRERLAREGKLGSGSVRDLVDGRRADHGAAADGRAPGRPS